MENLKDIKAMINKIENLVLLAIVAILMAGPFLAVADTASDVAAIAAKVTDADRDGKHTAPGPKEMDELCNSILKGGAANVKVLVNMLVEPKKSGDYKARYLLHSLVVYVSNPGRDAERKIVSKVLRQKLSAKTGNNVKVFVISELQFLRDKVAVSAIANCLLENATCDAACRALITIKGIAPAKLLKALPKAEGRNKLTIIQALGELKYRKSVKALIPILEDKESGLRIAAAVALGDIGDNSAVSPMELALEKASGYEKMKITDACFTLASTLAESGAEKDAFAIYSNLLKLMGTNENIQSAVVDGMIKAYSSSSTGDLVKKLKKADLVERRAILSVLGERKDPEVFDVVAAAVTDEDAGVRQIAIAAVIKQGGSRSVAPLIAVLPCKTVTERNVIRRALVDVKGSGVDQAIADGLAKISDAPSRITLLNVLGQRNTPKGVDAAIKLVFDKDKDTRITALKALSTMVEGDDASKLTTLLPKFTESDELKALENALLAACRRIDGNKNQIKPLEAAFGSGTPQTRTILLRVAGRLQTSEAANFLARIYKENTGEIQLEAIRRLSIFSKTHSIPHLYEIATSSSEVKHQILAMRGYVRIADKEQNQQKKLKLLVDGLAVAKRSEEKRAIIRSLSGIHLPGSLNCLVSCLDDSAVADDAGRAATSLAAHLSKSHRDQVRQAMEEVVKKAKNKDVVLEAELLLNALP
jgi:HEAT repeat protein